MIASSIMAVVISLVLVVLLYIYILPEAKKPYLNQFFQLVHEFLTIKTLWVDKIFRFFYVFSAVSSVVYGVFMLFNDFTFVIGLISLLLGPIACRIVYELLLLQIILVQNVMEIKDQLKKR